MSRLRAVPEGPKGIVRWEEPPPPRTGNRYTPSKFAAAGDDLKKRPGQWAVVQIAKTRSGCDGGRAYFSRKGSGFECVARKKPDGRVYLYARYVGVETDPDD